MNKGNLSLKNLYRFIVNGDFPIYTDGIIPLDAKKGLTVNKFWQDMLIYPLKNGKNGRIIWRDTGSKNRYTSELINRSASETIFTEYAKEVSNVASGENLAIQIDNITRFLTNHRYRYENFVKKLPPFVEMCYESDPYMTEALKNRFLELFEQRHEYEQKGERGKVFFTSYVISGFLFYALLGDNMDMGLFDDVVNNDDMFIDNVWNMNNGRSPEKQREVNFMTTKDCELCMAPLNYNHFYGREEDLYSLKQRLHESQKCLISGIGGTGKTELMRQFLRCCMEDKLVDYICTIQYVSSLAESIQRAFKYENIQEPQDALNKMIDTINAMSRKKVLVLIDNYDNSEADDPSMQKMLDMNAAVFVSSRKSNIEGYETYALKGLSDSACRLIFADNYGKVINSDEFAALDDILKNRYWHHPLTLQILARSADSLGWNVSRVREEIVTKGSALPIHIGEITQDYEKVLKYIYDKCGIRDRYGIFLQLFALLPYANYDLKFINDSIAKYIEKLDNLTEELTYLSSLGWLEKNEEGYSMHPFVSECIKEKDLPIDETNEFIKFLLSEKQNGLFDILAVSVVTKCVKALKEDVALEILDHLMNVFLTTIFSAEGQKLIRELMSSCEFESVKGWLKYYELLFMPKEMTVEELRECENSLQDIQKVSREKYRVFMAMLAHEYMEKFAFDDSNRISDLVIAESDDYTHIAMAYYNKLIIASFDPDISLTKKLSEDAFLRLDEKIPKNSIYYIVMLCPYCSYLVNCNDMDRAVKVYNRMLEYSDSNSSILVGAALDIAYARIKEGEKCPDEAIMLFESALSKMRVAEMENGANYIMIKLAMARIYKNNGRIKEAYKIFSQVPANVQKMVKERM